MVPGQFLETTLKILPKSTFIIRWLVDSWCPSIIHTKNSDPLFLSVNSSFHSKTISYLVIYPMRTYFQDAMAALWNLNVEGRKNVGLKSEDMLFEPLKLSICWLCNFRQLFTSISSFVNQSCKTCWMNTIW